jgi:hypothetical protein
LKPSAHGGLHDKASARRHALLFERAIIGARFRLRFMETRAFP